MKRIIAMLLNAALLLTLFPTQAIAETAKAVPEPSVSASLPENSGADTTGENTALIEPLLGAVLPPKAGGSGQQGYGKLMYLSDYSPSEMVTCQVGWGSYTRDRNLDGNPITLWINGVKKSFYKGVTAHATARLIFDLGENHADYDLFKAYIGVDAGRGSNGNVLFSFSGSADGQSWTTLASPATAYKGNTPAGEIELQIKAYRYFKVDISSNGANTADHAVLADACFVTDGYTPPTVDTLKDGETDMNEAYFAAKLQSVTSDDILKNTEAEMTLLRYTLVNACGYQNLYTFLTTSEHYQERIDAFTWLFHDLEALREFMNGGMPAGGSYLSALDVLSDLYAVYQDDLTDQTPLRKPEVDGAVRGALYRRMMLTMSLVSANGLGAWLARAEVSNPVNRYAYFKENYVNEKMRDEIFENLGVDELRWVIGNNISDAEIVWLNDYARAHPRGGNQTSYPIIYSPHHHIAYQWYDYDKDIYYSEDNRALYTERYMLSGYEKYGLVYGRTESGEKVAQRLWQVFADGAVCGNISRTGANLAASFGVPACEVGQPGHAAFLIMNKGSNNQMVWGIDNDISGWTQSSNSRRMPADWGNSTDSWNSGWRVPYVLLAQAALNDLENYQKAEEILMLLALAADNTEKEALCRAALEVMPYHLDAWLTLIKLYTADGTKTADDLAALAEELCASPMQFYPKPLNDLMQLIFNRLNAMISAGDGDARVALARAQMLFQQALTRATKATEKDTAQPGPAKTVANSLLSASDLALATFSFDGADSGKLVFREGFTSVRFRLSLDGESWSFYQITAGEDGRAVYPLTPEELAAVNAADDILIWLDGWPSADGQPTAEGAFKIDILAGAAVSGIEFNDHENRFIGNVSAMEYSLDDGKTWDILTNDTLFEGVRSISVHKKASGTTLMGLTKIYQSTSDNTTDRAYIPISRLSVAAFSSQQESQNDYAQYTIDGLYATRWHTAWNGSDKDKFIILKTDAPTYISGFDYTPSSGNGTVYAGQVLVSLDGESWVTAADFSGWANNSTVKSLTFSPVYGQYVKFAVTNSVGGFVSARALELYEDRTIADKKIVGISLLTLPIKRDYVRGEELDLTGASAKIVFEDQSSTILPISMLTPGKTVLDQVGRQEITLTYSSFAPVSFHVNVTERDFTPTSIKVVNLPDRVIYYAGDALTSEGIGVTATDGKTTVYLAEDELSLTGSLSSAGEAEVTVTMVGTALTDHFTVTVKKAITSIEVTAAPEKTVYELGDRLDTAGLVITARYADGSSGVLSEKDGLLINSGSFSEEEGSYDIPVLIADRQSVGTSFRVTVYPYFTKDGIRYAAGKDHTCSVISIETDASFVAIPQSVRFGSTVYTVTRIDENVLADAPTVTEVALPGSIREIGEDAFMQSASLQRVYLTAHTDFERLTVSDSAFAENVDISLYAASDALSEELTDSLKEKPFAEGIKVNNVATEIDSIAVTPPTFTVVNRGGTLSDDGYAIAALLKDGQRIPLDPSSCTRTPVNTAVSGSYTVTVTLLSDPQITDSYRVTVMDSSLTITVNPKDALYVTSDALTEPLLVAATSDGIGDVLTYQWYNSPSGVMNPEQDIIPGATNPSYTPTEKGFYYAIVGIEGTEYRVFSMIAQISMGDFTAIVGNKGYDTLKAAVEGASSGETIELLKDVTLSSGISVNKSLSFIGNGHAVTRSKGFADAMFTLNGAGDGITVNMTDITLDGGAGWYGETHEQLLRGCLSDNIAAAPIICANGRTKLYLNEKTVLQNNYNNNTGTKDNTRFGGAINAKNNVYIELNGAAIRDNYSYIFGSAIYQRDTTTLVINDCFIHGNSGSAQWNTSAICVDNTASCTVNGGSFCHNVGADKGDVLWVSNGKLEINGGSFEDNVSNNGRSIYINGSADVTVDGADKLGSIYLNSGKAITLGQDLPEEGVSIITNGSAFQENTAIVRFKEGVDPLAMQEYITLDGAPAGINAEGKLIRPCTSHIPSTEWKVIRDSTCSQAGEKVKVCTVCGYRTSTAEIEKKNHTPQNVSKAEPACGVPGHEAGEVCSVCGQTVSGLGSISALTHDFSKETAREAASCTEKGSVTYQCTHCTETKTETLDQLGHQLATDHIAPTCEADGYQLIRCERCKEEIEKTTEGSATGHTFGDASWNWSSDGKSATASVRCNCGTVSSATASVSNGTITSRVTKEATSSEMGETTYTAKLTLEGKTVEDSKTVADIPKTESDNFIVRAFRAIGNFFKKLFGKA